MRLLYWLKSFRFLFSSSKYSSNNCLWLVSSVCEVSGVILGFSFLTLAEIDGIGPNLVIGIITGDVSLFAVVVTGGIIGSIGKGGSTGGTSGGIAPGMNPLLPYAIDNAELIVLPNRLKELEVERLPVAAEFASKLDHKNKFCSFLAPDLNKNLPSLDVVDKSLEYRRI